MKKLFSAAVLMLALLGSVSSPALACSGTVHLPHCGASGNFC